MTTKVRIAAVGDILMWQKQIDSAQISGTNRYSFDGMFKEVASYLRKADLTIGNLETTFSGRERLYERKNPKTQYPMFNCPDELAGSLKRVGFDVLTTANNHCMDRSESGLRRTLQVLDSNEIKHTGTFRSVEESRKPLIIKVNGIKIGILAYTYGTNYLPVPQSWMVNRIHDKKMKAEISYLKSRVDLVIIALHFGREFRHSPGYGQRTLVDNLLDWGADIILGSHPHVLQPMYVKDNKKLVIYSLGNFISDRMRNNIDTESSIILCITVMKDINGKVRFSRVSYIPTWVHRYYLGKKIKFRVLPIRFFLNYPDRYITKKDLDTMNRVWVRTTKLIKGRAK
ncbi:CapA family protein [Microaerobacter geothermalis]|uniref:CapA family protein n=1 Tax=Microaerobacter geothermalis TaxID=674972 RepID=UPI001F20F8BE|nr:CapA family protein [Microaerobacter geothermalis]MCF6093091.1 CapA family protein [Microaerobacter geothermalis]